MSFAKEWIYRLRHNRGFGVQSPAAFYLVTHVLRESRHQYYLYPQINSLAHATGCSSAHCRRLFRLVNAIAPRNIFIIDKNSSAAACSVAAACKRVPCTMTSEAQPEAAREFLGAHTHCHTKKEPREELKSFIERHKSIGLMYVGNTPHYAEAVREAIEHCNRHTVIIVENINSQERRKWWNELVASPRTVVTMDFHRWGALFFDNEYKKQHYTFWFK